MCAGADAPGSDSLTQEEQVSSLTMAAFDECLLNVDLPALNIPRSLPAAARLLICPAIFLLDWGHRPFVHLAAVCAF